MSRNSKFLSLEIISKTSITSYALFMKQQDLKKGFEGFYTVYVQLHLDA